jgi:hypothetical protein
MENLTIRFYHSGRQFGSGFKLTRALIAASLQQDSMDAGKTDNEN